MLSVSSNVQTSAYRSLGILWLGTGLLFGGIISSYLSSWGVFCFSPIVLGGIETSTVQYFCVVRSWWVPVAVLISSMNLLSGETWSSSYCFNDGLQLSPPSFDDWFCRSSLLFGDGFSPPRLIFFQIRTSPLFSIHVKRLFFLLYYWGLSMTLVLCTAVFGYCAYALDNSF